MRVTTPEISSRFDELLDRRGTDSIKWSLHDADVLPMWVADMDFRSAPPVVAALRARAEHGIYGYPAEPESLRGLIVERLQRRFGWTIELDWIVWLPNVYAGFHLAAHAVTRPGDGALIHTPMYFPILGVPDAVGLRSQTAPLAYTADGQYELDLDRTEAVLDGRSRLFILCNPHNPVGRVYRRGELEELAELSARHALVVCSDEIHADFVYSGHLHVPIASVAPEIAARTITLMSPAKSFNLAGIPFAYAVIPDATLRDRYEKAKAGLVPHPGVFGFTAAVAAYQDGTAWLDELVAYLEGNRDTATTFLRERIPQVRMTPLEGTYLAWLNCRGLGSGAPPYATLLEDGRVATVDGDRFGEGGNGFVRVNLACPRQRLLDGLERICASLERRRAAR